MRIRPLQSTPVLALGLGASCFALTPGARAQTPAGDLAPDEIRAIVAEALADAQTRSSLLQSQAGAGHDGHFFIQSPDGGFRLNVSGQLQFRYLANFRDDEGGTADDFDTGFTASRTALRFDGHIYDSSLFYGVQGNFTSDDGGFELEDAFVGHQFDNGLILMWGQYREPILWEDVLNETSALAVDQSVVNAVFGQGRSQGVWVHYSAENWRMWGGFNDGVRSANTDLASDSADFGLTTRWDWKLAGAWSQFDQFTSPRGSDFAAKLGVGGHWERSPDAPGGPRIADTLAWVADLMLAGDGWNAFFTGTGFHTDPNGGSSTDDYGFVAQGGLFLTDDIEPFLRYDVVIPDSDRAGDDAFHTITFGANYYLHGQAAKATLDVVWFLDDTAGNDLVAGAAGTAAGRRAGLLPSGDSDQVAIRLQFQLLF